MITSGWRDNMKYKLIPEDIVKNMIDFLDEYQFDAAKDNPTSNPEALHKINFCNWMINELLNSYDGFDSNQIVRFKIKPTTKDLKDKDWDSILKSFDSFFKGMDIAYQSSLDADGDDKNDKMKDMEDKIKKRFEEEGGKVKKNKKDEWKPRLEDVSEHCTLPEIEEFLKDDPELTDNERFELYYDERERIKKQKEINKGQSLDQMCKDLGIKRNPGKNK